MNKYARKNLAEIPKSRNLKKIEECTQLKMYILTKYYIFSFHDLTDPNPRPHRN